MRKFARVSECSRIVSVELVAMGIREVLRVGVRLGNWNFWMKVGVCLSVCVFDAVFELWLRIVCIIVYLFGDLE